MLRAQCVRKTRTATMQSRDVRNAVVALREQMATCLAGLTATKNNSKSFIVVQKLHIFPLSLDSGQCNCADRVEGRQCDHCVWGAWNYPTCDPCDCDTKGTTEKICDQVKLAEFEQKYRIRNLCHCKMFRQHQNVSASLTWSQAAVTSARKASSTFRRPIPSAAWSASASVVPRSALRIQH